MISQVQDFVAAKAQTLHEQVSRIRAESIQSARAAAQESAESLRSLKSPVRVVARSGVRLTSVSQAAVQEMIELQSEMFTAAIADVALRLERAARAANVVELVRDQVGMLPATRARIASDAGRAVQIVVSAGHEIRVVATQALERVSEAAEKPATTRRASRRPARKATRRATVRSRKAAA